MKAKRILAVVILILVIGVGIGYWMGVLPTWRSTADSKPQGPASPLRIEEQKDAALGESGVEAHRDLRLHNQADKPATIRLVATDCECARVEVCVTPDQWKQLDSDAFRKRAAEPALTWQILKRDGESFTIPPLAHGLIRVTWKAIKVGASSIGIFLRVEDGENQWNQRFEVPVNFIEPVWLCAEGNFAARNLDVGRLKAGAERTVKLLCCSTTRKKFTLTPAPPLDDPCIVYGTPQPLTAKEIEALPKTAGGDPVLSAFHVPVTVKERTKGKQFDIGPFHRAIIYSTDVSSDLKVVAFLDGTVEGEVGLASSEGKDHVDLGLVIPTKPQPVTFTLQSRDAQLQLTLDERRTLDFLKVELLDGKDGKPAENGKRWRVRAIFQADSSFRGPVPNPNQTGYTSADQCSIVFTVSHPGTTAPARRLRIPVRGTVRVY